MVQKKQGQQSLKRPATDSETRRLLPPPKNFLPQTLDSQQVSSGPSDPDR
ncbi:hypothetical protein [Microcystis aeruginosa]|uniref:Uncharacterized protein n=1 Tax=Microcystis aeruginosa FD4 TaxID=2686288 RepID=A0A857D7P5_MICAE|nr:hypothetical protein [Microcystis aeruginosa]QGZ91572.1 hypothetical protein GQR42_20705 [Microcystis aeruginosa FD4]